MNPQRWQAVKSVLAAAIPLPVAERGSYLDAACAGDSPLRAEVETLLAAHDQAGAIVDRPAAAYVTGIWPDAAHDAASDVWFGRRIGPYRLVALLGHGGMGRVYRAERADAEFDKAVAIKLVPGGYHSSFVLERLRVERQILADLEHPNIARLVDGGATDDGTPYLVMELVEGEPLDRFAERRGLGVTERLRLFVSVCAAVSYAHRHLVVHRDLKPGNVLVTADGTVKLLDFGIAKLLQTPGTGAPAPTTAMPALTPGYASPEQILGAPVTTSSDVYSLGVVLFNLLTGASPYRTQLESTAAVLRDVCEAAPLRPSHVAAVNGQPRVDRDLDAIVLRALRKEPAQRYATVAQLADDLQRYLDGRPVTARDDQLGYHLRKFLRRHRLEAAAVGVAALTLVAGSLIALRQADIASQQEAQANEQRQRAERHFASVRHLADVFMFQVHDEISALPGATRAREVLVGTALEYLNALAAEAGGDRELQRDLAAAFERVGNIQGEAYEANTGKPRAALDSYSRAVELLEPLVAANPDDRAARDALGWVQLRRSRLLLLLGDTQAATTASAASISSFEALAANQPDQAEPAADRATRGGLAAAFTVHSYNLDMAGADELAGAAGKRGVEMLEGLTRDYPDDLDVRADLGSAYSTLANIMLGTERSPEVTRAVLELHRKALAISEQLVAQTDGRNTAHVRSVVADRTNVGILLFELADYRGALQVLSSIAPLLASLGDDPDNAQVALDSVATDWHLGRTLLALGDLDDAAAVFQRNADALERIARNSDTLQVQYLIGTSLYGLGAVRAQLAGQHSSPADQLGQWQQARRYFAAALPHFERVTASVVLDHVDRQPVEDAGAWLARAELEIAGLGRTANVP